MFDFGFFKLFLLFVVALVVIGPERLPRVARTAGALYGRLQRYVAQVKSDVRREMEAADLHNVKNEFESAARAFQSTVETNVREAESQMREATASIERSLEANAPAANDPPVPAGEAAAPPASPQLELGIDEPAPPAARDRASG
ncbi:MAG TPA: Sec-independent protein translocase protein TatB [Usitatibacter sp.]|nr:Sec-independent protein translocase protein TatB [Usitatibacter sp.]